MSPEEQFVDDERWRKQAGVPTTPPTHLPQELRPRVFPSWEKYARMVVWLEVARLALELMEYVSR